MQNEKLKEFFSSHPHIDEVHIANDVLFIDKKNADAFSKDAKKVKTFSREALQQAQDADAAKQKAADDEAKRIKDAIEKEKSEMVKEGFVPPATPEAQPDDSKKKK